MNTELVRTKSQQPQDLDLDGMMTIADMFCKSGMFADVRDVAKAFVKIQAGKEIGVPPFAAMRGVSIIQGQAALGATLVAGRMKAHGYDWTEIRRDAEVCELEITKPNGKPAGVARFSMDDAKLAGLSGKDNWKKYPKAMLFARCITDAARTFAPEVFSGIPVYTPEELGETNTSEDGDSLPPTQAQILQAKLEEAQAAGFDVDPQAEAKKYGEAKVPFAVLKAFGELKKDFLAIDKGSVYYDVLRQFRYRSSKDIPSRDAASLVYQAMKRRLHDEQFRAESFRAEKFREEDAEDANRGEESLVPLLQESLDQLA